MELSQYFSQPPSLQEYRSRIISMRIVKQSRVANPLLSIITIVYNSGRTLEQTICSVLNQDFTDYEYILIDGASTDGSMEVISKYYSNIHLIVSEPDNGISDAMNKGIALSNGSLIGIIHANDWYEANIFSQVASLHRQHPTAILHGNLQYWKNETRYYVTTADESKLKMQMTIHHPTIFVPRAIYESVGLYRRDFKFAMDHEWAMRAKYSGQKFIYLQTIIANMRIDGVSNKKWIKAYLESARGRKMVGTSLVKNVIITSKAIVITAVRRLLEYVGMQSVLTWYRRKYSVIKKYHQH